MRMFPVVFTDSPGHQGVGLGKGVALLQPEPVSLEGGLLTIPAPTATPPGAGMVAASNYTTDRPQPLGGQDRNHAVKESAMLASNRIKCMAQQLSN
jgi:hypothetical protein